MKVTRRVPRNQKDVRFFRMNKKGVLEEQSRKKKKNLGGFLQLLRGCRISWGKLEGSQGKETKGERKTSGRSSIVSGGKKSLGGRSLKL